MAKCTITVKGNLGRDVETKISKAGKSYSVLAVGSTPSKKNANGEWENGETMWFNVTVFDELNPFEYKKGTPVELEGTFTSRQFVKKDGTPGFSLDVAANNIMTIQREKAVSPNSSQAQDNWNKPSGWTEVALADDMPF